MTDASAYGNARKVAAKMLANDTQPRLVRKAQTPTVRVSPASVAVAPVEDAARIAAAMEQVAKLRSLYPDLSRSK